MTEALNFAIRVFLKQGVWIIGAGWLLAVGSWAFFVREAGGVKSEEDGRNMLRRKVILGVIILVTGIFIAL